MSPETLTHYSAAIDIPDSRDFTHGEVFGEYGGSGNIPKKTILDIAPVLDQGNTWACTVFGSSMAYNETFAQKARENYYQPFDPWPVWSEAKKRGASDTKGWIFQGALQLLKDLGHIGGYLRIEIGGGVNVDILKNIIASGKGIASGVKYADWAEVKRTGEWNPTTNQGGHIFALTGYDDNHEFSDGYKGGFYSPNSWGGDGAFWIRYKDIKNFYSRYEFVLASDLEKFIEAKQKRRNLYLQRAFDAKIWNEQEPQRIAFPTEIAKMFKRSLGYSDTRRMRVYVVARIIDRFMVRGKWESLEMVYSQKDVADDLIVAQIFTQAAMRNTGIRDMVLSRAQVAEIIGRDFLI